MSGKDRRTLQSFPPSKRRGRLSTHAAVQRDGLRPLFFTVTLPRPWGRLSLSGSPLYTDPLCGFTKPFRYTMPGRPSPCPGHYREAFGSSAASVLPPAPWHCRVLPREGERCGSAPVPTPETRATRSGRLDAGRLGNHACQRADLPGLPPCPCGPGVCPPRFTPPASRRFTQRFLASAEVAGLERSCGSRKPVTSVKQWVECSSTHVLVVHNGDGAHRFLGLQSPGPGLERGRGEAPGNPSPATDGSSIGDNRQSNAPGGAADALH